VSELQVVSQFDFILLLNIFSMRELIAKEHKKITQKVIDKQSLL